MDDEEDTRTNGRSVLLPTVLGFMAGALSGAAVALLLAPASGQDVRQGIGGVYRKSTRTLGRFPAALKSAGKAAQIAFADASADGGSAESNEPGVAGANSH